MSAYIYFEIGSKRETEHCDLEEKKADLNKLREQLEPYLENVIVRIETCAISLELHLIGIGIAIGIGIEFCPSEKR